jgi:hypothetical protein
MAAVEQRLRWAREGKKNWNLHGGFPRLGMCHKFSKRRSGLQESQEIFHFDERKGSLTGVWTWYWVWSLLRCELAKISTKDGEKEHWGPTLVTLALYNTLPLNTVKPLPFEK